MKLTEKESKGAAAFEEWLRTEILKLAKKTELSMNLTALVLAWQARTIAEMVDDRLDAEKADGPRMIDAVRDVLNQ